MSSSAAPTAARTISDAMVRPPDPCSGAGDLWPPACELGVDRHLEACDGEETRHVETSDVDGDGAVASPMGGNDRKVCG